MPNAQIGQQKVNILKKTTGLWPSRSYTLLYAPNAADTSMYLSLLLTFCLLKSLFLVIVYCSPTDNLQAVLGTAK